MTKKLEIKLDTTVNKMVASLKEVAAEKNVSLEGITIKNFNVFLDDAFRDGGEIRCDRFTDLAIEYALQFGLIEDHDFLVASWKAVERAVNRVSRNPL